MVKNKKYFTKDGQVNVKKVCKDIDVVRQMLLEVSSIVKCSRQEEFKSKMMLCQMKMIDISEDLKGHVNNDSCGV